MASLIFVDHNAVGQRLAGFLAELARLIGSLAGLM